MSADRRLRRRLASGAAGASRCGKPERMRNGSVGPGCRLSFHPRRCRVDRFTDYIRPLGPCIGASCASGTPAKLPFRHRLLSVVSNRPIPCHHRWSQLRHTGEVRFGKRPGIRRCCIPSRRCSLRQLDPSHSKKRRTFRTYHHVQKHHTGQNPPHLRKAQKTAWEHLSRLKTAPPLSEDRRALKSVVGSQSLPHRTVTGMFAPAKGQPCAASLSLQRSQRRGFQFVPLVVLIE